jgi:hypothetical protein
VNGCLGPIGRTDSTRTALAPKPPFALSLSKGPVPRPPFAQSLSKGLVPKPPFALSLSKGASEEADR